MRRNLAIATALGEAAPAASVLLATSVDDGAIQDLPATVDVLRLPGVKKLRQGRYVARQLSVSELEIRDLRTELLLAAMSSFQPDVLLVDRHPLGVCGELAPALELHAKQGGRAALGLRDILDDPAAVALEWADQDVPELIADFYDLVLVYGDPGVLDPIEAYSFGPAVAERTRFCGYVTASPVTHASRLTLRRSDGDGARMRALVIATAGGGEDGAPLLATFIEASLDAPWDAIVIAGPLASSETRATLEALADEAGVAFRRAVPTLASWFGSAAVVVSMGGYNTLVEAAAGGVPVVCVPRVYPRKEQLIRARAFAELGLLRLVEPAELTHTRLRDEIESALATPRAEFARHAMAALDFDGARRAAGYLLDLTGHARSSSGQPAHASTP